MRRPASVNTRNALAVAALVLAAGLIAHDPDFWLNLLRVHRDGNRAEVMALHRTLRAGLTEAEVVGLLTRPEYRHLELHGGCNSGTCVVETPLEWGARNWVVWLHFDRGTLTAARIRTLDSAEEHPPGAPRDLAVSLDKATP